MRLLTSAGAAALVVTVVLVAVCDVDLDSRCLGLAGTLAWAALAGAGLSATALRLDRKRSIGVVAAIAYGAVAVRAAYAALDGYLAGSRWGVEDARATLLLSIASALSLGAAALASMRSPRGLALGSGLALGGAVASPCFVVLAMAAAAAASLALSGERDLRALLRDRIGLVPLGALVALCAGGLCADAAATLAPRGVVDTMRWWSVDPSGERVVRVLLELAVTCVALGLARGRTWAALAIVPLGCALAWCADHFRGPMWGAGCLSWSHPLARGAGTRAVVLVALSVGPWAAPLARALVRVVYPADERHASS